MKYFDDIEQKNGEIIYKKNYATMTLIGKVKGKNKTIFPQPTLLSAIIWVVGLPLLMLPSAIISIYFIYQGWFVRRAEFERELNELEKIKKVERKKEIL